MPFDIIQLIANYSDLNTKLNIKYVNKFLYENLRIYALYDTICVKYKYGWSLYTNESPNISHKLNGFILNNFKYITVLNLVNNIIINDKDIKHLLNLHTLYVNEKISDEGIKHMNLHTLNAYENSGITNKYNNAYIFNGIRHKN